MASNTIKTDIRVEGEIALTTVPNQTGTLLTLSSVDGETISTRTNTQIIADLGLEVTSNKASTLSSPNNTTYPTTLAVQSAISALDGNYVTLLPGTLNATSSPYSGDLNTINPNSQFWFSSSVSNKPSFVNNGGMAHYMAMNNGSDFTGMTVIGWGDDEFGYRSRYAGTWSNWHQVASRDWTSSQGYYNSGFFRAANVASGDANVDLLTNGGFESSYNTGSWLSNGASGFLYGGLVMFGQGNNVGNNANSGLQLQYDIGHNGTNQAGRLAFRTIANGGTTFNPWKEIADRDWVTAQGYELLLNKAVNFSVINNIKYPTTLAVNNGYIGGLYSTGTPLSAGAADLTLIDSKSHFFFASSTSTGMPSGTLSGVVENMNVDATRAKMSFFGVNNEDLYFYKRWNGNWYQVASREWIATQLHSPVTITGENYLSLSGQQITANPVSLSGTNVTGILPFAKLPNINANRLLGRRAGTSGVMEEITLGSNLSLTTTGVLSAAGTDLSLGSGNGSINSSTGAGTTLTSLGKINAPDANADFGLGLTVYSSLSTATNFPSSAASPAGTGFSLIRAAGTNVGRVDFWTATSNDDKLYFRTGGGTTTFNNWHVVADRDWVSSQNYLTANQTITLTGDVTGSGSTSIVTTLAANAVATTNIQTSAVTYAKIQDMPTANLLGRVTAGTGNVEDLTATQVRTLLNVADGATNVTNNNQLTNGAGYITSASIPTVNDGTLTLSTGTGLSGAQSFSANQSTNATFNVSIASGYTLPTNTQVTTWNGKQDALSGTGFVKALGSTISYDNSTYFPVLPGDFNTYSSNTFGVYESVANTATGVPSGITGDNYHILSFTNIAGTQLAVQNNTATLWIRSISGASSFGSWIQMADRPWVTSQGYTTNTGTVTSVASTVGGNALNVTGTPITSSGTLAFTWAGTSAQYVNGLGNLTTFPTIPAQVNLSNGTGISISGTYPNLTITNSSPNATHTGDVTGATVLTIAANAVTYAKLQNQTGPGLLGKGTTGAGATGLVTIGSGLTLTTGNVLSATPYTLPIASATILGGIKVGTNLSIDGTGVLSSTDTTYTAGNGLTLSGTQFSLPVTISGTGTYVQSVVQNTNGITVTLGTPPNTVYTLPTATATVLGGIELFSNTVQSVAANAVSTTANRTYGVQLNSADQAVVNVPWTDTNTTYSGSTSISLSGTSFQRAALTGDVTALANNNTTIIAPGVVSNSKLADMPALSVKGNIGGTTTSPVDVSVADLSSVLTNGFENDSFDYAKPQSSTYNGINTSGGLATMGEVVTANTVLGANSHTVVVIPTGNLSIEIPAGSSCSDGRELMFACAGSALSYQIDLAESYQDLRGSSTSVYTVVGTPSKTPQFFTLKVIGGDWYLVSDSI